MRKKKNFRIVIPATRLSERMALTAIVIGAVIGIALTKAILLGEFNWLGGG